MQQVWNNIECNRCGIKSATTGVEVFSMIYKKVSYCRVFTIIYKKLSQGVYNDLQKKVSIYRGVPGEGDGVRVGLAQASP